MQRGGPPRKAPAHAQGRGPRGRAPRTAPRRTAGARSALGPRFWQLWAASGLSSIGDGLVLVAFPLLALSITHSPLLIAGLAVADRLPSLAVGLLAGAYADRVDRRRLAFGIEWLRCAVLAGFGLVVLGGHDNILVLYAVVFILGTCDIFFSAATMAALPGLVDADGLGRANSWMVFSDLTAQEVAGQTLGGILIAVGRALPLLADAVSFVASAALVRRALPSMPAERRPVSLRTDISDGLRWFARHPVLRMIALLISSIAFCQCLVLSILVLYARVDLHLSSTGYGLFLAAAGAATIVGALVSSPLTDRLGSLGGVAVGGFLTGGGFLIMAFTSSVIGAGAGLATEVIGVVVCNVATTTLRQTLIPPDMLGRVGTTIRMGVYIGMTLGALGGGLLAEAFSLRVTFFVAGGLVLLLVVGLVPRVARHLAHEAAEVLIDLRPNAPARGQVEVGAED